MRRSMSREIARIRAPLWLLYVEPIRFPFLIGFLATSQLARQFHGLMALLLRVPKFPSAPRSISAFSSTYIRILLNQPRRQQRYRELRNPARFGSPLAAGLRRSLLGHLITW